MEGESGGDAVGDAPREAPRELLRLVGRRKLKRDVVAAALVDSFGSGKPSTSA